MEERVSSAAVGFKRPASPPARLPAASRARLGSPCVASRDGGAASPRQAGPERRTSVNLDADGATPSRSPTPSAAGRWSWPPGEAGARVSPPRADAAGDSTDDSSSDEDEGVSRDVPCCALWAAACADARRCVHGARCVRRIHDEDGAAVDVVWTRQRFDSVTRAAEPLPAAEPPRAVVYKTYDTVRNDSLEYLVQTELALYAETRGRAHIIPLLDSFRDARGNPVLVFPYVPDDHTPREPSAVRSYMRQLLQALAFLHDELGVMHRNIKRANVLFSSAGALTLIDFEGACHVSAGAVYTRFGNNLYRAPEVAAAKAGGNGAAAVYAYNAFDDVLSPCAPYGCAADVFSAGAVFFELLTGARRLLDGEEPLSEQYAALEESLAAEQRRRDADSASFDPRTPFAHRAAAEGGPPALARLTWDAADLLRRMLVAAPAKRVTAAEALEHPYFTRPDADAADDAAFFAAVERERERGHGVPRRDAAPHVAPRRRAQRHQDDDGARN